MARFLWCFLGYWWVRVTFPVFIKAFVVSRCTTSRYYRCTCAPIHSRKSIKDGIDLAVRCRYYNKHKLNKIMILSIRYQVYNLMYDENTGDTFTRKSNVIMTFWRIPNATHTAFPVTLNTHILAKVLRSFTGPSAMQLMSDEWCLSVHLLNNVTSAN